MANAINITVRTPKKTWRIKDYKEMNNKFQDQLKKNVATVVLNKMAESADVVKMQTLNIVAVFFQRVVSRTPLDEVYYEEVETEFGTEFIIHVPDNNQCRYDWKLKLGQKEITSGDIKEALGEGVFERVNNQESINAIKEYLLSVFGKYTKDGSIRDFRKITIWNDNPHFDVLEYGGNSPNAKKANNWPLNSEPKKGVKYEHGVTNYHSVQAPVGMLRITQLELTRSSFSTAKSPLANRYKGTKNQRAKVPSDFMLNSLLKKVEQGGILYFEDIERYIGQR